MLKWVVLGRSREPKSEWSLETTSEQQHHIMSRVAQVCKIFAQSRSRRTPPRSLVPDDALFPEDNFLSSSPAFQNWTNTKGYKSSKLRAAILSTIALNQEFKTSTHHLPLGSLMVGVGGMRCPDADRLWFSIARSFG